MRRAKRHSGVKFVSNNKDAEIKEKLILCGKGDPSSIIEIGKMVEDFLKSPIAIIIESLTNGRKSFELEQSRNSSLSSDRFIGRLEMSDLLWKDLEQYVLDKDLATRRVRTGDRVKETHNADSPNIEEEFVSN